MEGEGRERGWREKEREGKGKEKVLTVMKISYFMPCKILQKITESVEEKSYQLLSSWRAVDSLQDTHAALQRNVKCVYNQ